MWGLKLPFPAKVDHAAGLGGMVPTPPSSSSSRLRMSSRPLPRPSRATTKTAPSAWSVEEPRPTSRERFIPSELDEQVAAMLFRDDRRGAFFVAGRPMPPIGDRGVTAGGSPGR